MRFRPEPAYRHGQPAQTAVLLVNLGTPDAPTAPALRRYLAEFLERPARGRDPAPGVVADPARHHPAHAAGQVGRQVRHRSGPPTARRWRSGRSARPRRCRPLLDARGHQLTGARRRCATASRRSRRCWTRCAPTARPACWCCRCTRSTPPPPRPASVDKVMQWAQRARRMPELRFVGEYHDDPGYIDALAAPRARALGGARPRASALVLSFHGVPHRSLLLGDPYHCQCHKTARLLGERAGAGRATAAASPSRAASARHAGCEPYTEPTLRALAGPGRRSGGRDVPRLRRRLPGDAGRNRPGSARGLPRSRRRGLPLHPLPERPPRLDRGAGRSEPNAICRAGTRAPRRTPQRWRRNAAGRWPWAPPTDQPRRRSRGPPAQQRRQEQHRQHQRQQHGRHRPRRRTPSSCPRRSTARCASAPRPAGPGSCRR